MPPIAITATARLRAPPDDVWRFVADTDRTNRAIGAHTVDFAPIADSDPRAAATGARFLASTSAGGFAMTYEELPFEWSHGRELRVVRTMRGGLLESYVLTWSLAPGPGGGTVATVTLELAPRFGVLRPAVWLQGRRAVQRLVAFARSVDAHVVEKAPSPFAADAPVADDAVLDRAVLGLRKSGVRAELAKRIAAHVRDAADADLVRIRPFELAESLGEDRRDVLCAMLHGVPAGLFELRWAMICPSCNTASELATSLDQITAEGHCQLCDITFDLELDRAVEATFVPHESVRRVPPRMFCMGGPARTPHVWSQTNLAPRQSRALSVPPEPGRYRVFARGGATASVEVDAGAPREARATVGEAAIEPAEIRVASGGSITVTNATTAARHVKVERLGYASAAASAHYLSTVEEFRRLFSRDLLKRGTPLKVTRVSILFSDITGSTALYTKVGDASAFRLVDDHFDVLRSAIAAHDGVVVKTMGDAVMAGFRDPGACLRAAADALRGFERFRATREHGDLVGLKVGMFSGPCYVVTANGALDYFGQTVNVASRVQHLAGSGEIVVEHGELEALGEAARGAARLEVGERFEARVKGVDEPLDLVRVRVRAGDDAAPPAA